MNRLLVACVVGVLAAGCTPGSDKVCGQVVDHEARARGASLPDAERKAALDRCVQRVEGLRQKDATVYTCLAKCVMSAADVAGIQACEGSCNAGGVAIEVKMEGPAAGGALPPSTPPVGCRAGCKATLDSCVAACGDDPQCNGKCHAAYQKCGVDCVH